MRRLKRVVTFSLFVGVLNLTGGLVAGQDIPTPPPWSQATVDAAINNLLTQTAIAPAATALPATPTPNPAAFSDTLSGLSANYEPLQADNFDRMEIVGAFDFEGDYVIHHPITFGQNHRWLAVDQFDEQGGDLEQLTVWLIDRWQPELPARSIVIEELTNHDEYPTLDVQGSYLFYSDAQTGVAVYDIDTGARRGRLEDRAGILSFAPWVEQNRAVALTDNDEVVIWNLETLLVEQRWPTPRNAFYGALLRSSGVMLVYQEDGPAHALDLETGDLREAWAVFDERYPFAAARLDVFLLATPDSEILMVDNHTLETIHSLTLRKEEQFLVATPDGRFMMTWSDGGTLWVWDFEESQPLTSFPNWRGSSFDMNRSGDLLMLYDGDYLLYSLSERGADDVFLPDELAESDGQFDMLAFLFGEQLVSAQYNRQYTKAEISLWGVRA